MFRNHLGSLNVIEGLFDYQGLDTGNISNLECYANLY